MNTKTEFLKLYNGAVEEIFELCYEETLDRDEAKEMTTDAFIRMWHSLESPISKSEMRPKVFDIARSLIREHARKFQAKTHRVIPLIYDTTHFA